MFAATIAALIAALAVIVVIVVVVVARQRYGDSHASSNHRTVQTVDTVGFNTSGAVPPSTGSVNGTGEHGMPNKTPADSLRNRFVAMGVFAAAVFGALGTKLFGMQVLDSGSYQTAADDNRYSTVNTPAPRGYIYDRSGIPLVKNRSSLTILADADVADDYDVVGRLSAVLGIPRNIVRLRIQDTSSGAQSRRILESDASLRNVAFIREHSDAFPGIYIETRNVRDYPYGALAAHAIGYTGRVSQEELDSVAPGRNLQLGDDVGKSGVEATYDNLLSGDHGQRVVVADAEGNVREVKSETQPVRGSDIFTTICGPAQYVAEKALADLIGPENGAIGSGTGVAGTVVALVIEDGGVVVLANFPTFAPASFVGGISQSIWDIYNTQQSEYPLLNRAIAGTYPAASTFKSFTGLAGLKYGFADKKKTWDCTGWWDGFDSGDWQACWDHDGHGTLNFHDSIVNSCDTTFYEIAKDFWDAAESGKISYEAMQDEIKRFGFGAPCGIDISGEAIGRIPTRAWKAEYFKDTPEEASWRGGDMTNMVIGQGYVLVTPLQIACAYMGIASGKIMRPHLLKDVRNEQGDVIFSYKPEVVAIPEVEITHLQMVREALHGVVQENSNIYELFADAGIDGAAKTGTAEVAGKGDFALFACYAPYAKPKYVCCVLIEEGGGGSATAAPIGAEVLGALLDTDKGVLGSSDMGRINGSTGAFVERKQSSSSEGRTD